MALTTVQPVITAAAVAIIADILSVSLTKYLGMDNIFSRV